jgi:hypothetical protein
MVSADDQDLRTFPATRSHGSEIELLFPAELADDREHARYLEGANGVMLHPVADCADHELIRWVALRGELAPLLAGRISA